MAQNIDDLSISDLYAALEFLKIQKKDLGQKLKVKVKIPTHDYSLESLEHLETQMYIALFKKIMSYRSREF